MSEPVTITTTAVVSTTMGVTIGTLFPGVTPPILMGAIMGTAIYVMTPSIFPLWKQFIFAIISFVTGIIVAQPTTDIIDGLINYGLSHLNLNPPLIIKINPFIGALVAALIAITILLRIMKKSKTINIPGVDEGE